MLSGCAASTASENLSDSISTIETDYIDAYTDFLLNQRGAKTKDGWMSIIEVDIYNNSTESFEYALFDMNGDGILELHVRDYNCYCIFTWQNSELVLWHYTSGYYRPLNSCALLYTRTGGAPPHFSYQYEELDFWGNAKLHINFDRYDMNYDGIYDEDDNYIFGGSAVSKEEWDLLTEKYLSATSDHIEWFSLSEEVNHIQLYEQSQNQLVLLIR